MNKKAQMQIMESIVVLFIFFVILVMGLVTYMNFFVQKSKVTIGEQQEQMAVKIAQALSDMPELQCTKHGEVVPNCVDYWKLVVLTDDGTNSDYMNKTNRGFYSSILGYSDVSLGQLYPAGGDAFTLFTAGSYRYKKKIAINLPVLIYDPTQDGSCDIIGIGTCNFGMINVTSYT